MQAPSPSATSRRRRSRVRREDVRLALLICGAVVVIGSLVGVAESASSTSGGPTTTTTTETSTTVASSVASQASDPAITSQVKAAVDGVAPGSDFFISGAYLNALGNLKILTMFSPDPEFGPSALQICQVGKSLGFTDVEVRSSDNVNMASTGIVDNSCSRHV